MKKHSLAAQKRQLIGRKVKSLRRQGMLPATVYGKKVKSESLTVPADAFMKVYDAAGETGLVELSLDGDIRPVLIHTVQKDPVKGQPLHVEFYQVDLKEKVTTRVPLEQVGVASAVTNKVGVILTLLDEVEVEALPTDLPEKIVVDVSKLAEIDQEVKVGDLSVPAGVTVLTGAAVAVVRVGALISKEAEAQAAEEAAAAAAAAAAAEVPAAEAPAAGVVEEVKPGEEKPEEAKPEEVPVKPVPAENLSAQAGKKVE